MANIAKDTLLAAVLRFRDSLPADHDRRLVHKDVTDLRFDTQDPSICYLIVTADGKRDERARRIDPTLSLEKLAEALILYKVHTVLKFNLPADQAQLIKELRQPPIRDVFLSDTGMILLHVEEGTPIEPIQELIEETILRQTDEAKYLANKLFRNIQRAIAKGTSKDQGVLIEPRVDLGTVWHVQLLGFENGERLAKLKQEVETLLNRIREVERQAAPNGPTTMTNMFRDTLSVMFPEIWPMAADSKILASGTGEVRAPAAALDPELGE